MASMWTSSLNRNLVARYLKGILTFHLAYKVTIKQKEILTARVDQVLGADSTHRLHYVHTTPKLLLFRRALETTPEVQSYIINNDIIVHENNADDSNSKDQEIYEWLEAAWDEAEVEATRKGAPSGEFFSEMELTTCVPVDPENEDSDLEEESVRLHLQEDLAEAVNLGFSLVECEDVKMDPAEAKEPEEVDLSNWETVPDPGAANVMDDIDLISVTANETVELDDEENVESVAFTVTLKPRDDANEERVTEQEAEPKLEEEVVKRPAEKSANPIPDRPAEADARDVAAEKLEQATERAEDRVWLDP